MVEVSDVQNSSPLMVSRSMYLVDTAPGRSSHRWSMNEVAEQHSQCPTFLWSMGGAGVPRPSDEFEGM